MQESESLFSKAHQQIYQRLAQAEFPINATQQSYRTINHWDGKGILSDRRLKKNGWRKFNWFELSWIKIIASLRAFGIPIASLKACKDFLFSQSEHTLSEKPESLLLNIELAILNVLVLEQKWFLVLKQDGSYILSNSFEEPTNSGVLHLPLNPIIKAILAEEELQMAETVRAESVPEVVQSMIGLLRSKSFKRIMLTIENEAPLTLTPEASKEKIESAITRMLEGGYRKALLFTPNNKMITSETTK